jgi:excisionase family DNA binding protein
MTLAERLERLVSSLPADGAVVLSASSLRDWLAEHGTEASKAESPADRLIDADEVAARLGLSVRTVYRRARSWPFVRRVGRTVRFSSAGLERWLARQR